MPSQKIFDQLDSLIPQVFEDIVSGIGITMDLRLREPSSPFGKKVPIEDKVTFAPDDLYWLLAETLELATHAFDKGPRAVTRSQRDVLNEAMNGSPVLPRVIGGQISTTESWWQRLSLGSDVSGRKSEGVASPHQESTQPGTAAQGQGQGKRLALRKWKPCRIHQHDAPDELRVACCKCEPDHATPIVEDECDVFELQLTHQGFDIFNSLLESIGV